MEQTCKKCKVKKQLIHFVKNKNTKNGCEGTCKECKNKQRKTNLKLGIHSIQPGSTFCKQCEEVKSNYDFVIDGKCVKGHTNICKLCDAHNRKIRRAKHKKEMSHFYWDAKTKSINNRAKQNSITKQDLIKLYNKNRHCYYCNIKIDFTNIHIDHKQPLSRNGSHCINNLVLSCSDCNRLKYTKTEEEFKIFLKEFISRFK